MITLIINPGSSSVKYRLYKNNKIILNGVVDEFKQKGFAGNIILNKIKKIDKIVYRVVHGKDFANHCIITPKVLAELKKTIILDPNHMPKTIKLIEFFMKNTNAKHIACFDTIFHRTMPEYARIYPIPLRLTKKYNIQHYGFHGLAHQAMAEKGRGCSKIITCQLGNGVSISAVKNGKCIDTSMGFTPLEGVMMGTRSGSIDPAIIEFLCKKEGKTVSEVTKILQYESGLKGIANEADVRILLKRKDKNAKLAIEMFCYAIRKQIGAYIAALNGVDLIVLSGGISKNAPIRNKIMSGFDSKFLIYNADEQELMFNISKKFK